MPPFDKNTYVIRSSRGIAITVKRGTSPPQITGGGARYTTIQRPRRNGQIQWDGDDPYTMDLPILFDGWAEEIASKRNVERDIQQVNNMMHSPGAWVAPVTIKITGATPVKGGTWVITGIDYGDMVIWDTDKHGRGFRYRQDATLHLLQFLPETVLLLNAKAGTTIPHVVKTGETLQSIAKRAKTTPAAIKKANNIRDPKSIKAGQRLLVPVPSLKDVFEW